MNRKKTIIITTIVTVSIIIFFRKRIEWMLYDLQEYFNEKDSLVWKENRKLNWNDFIYNTEKKYADNIYAYVGISQRYHIDQKIDYRSKTLFVPNKSFVTDTTNKKALRIAQARFNLCEVYRRKLEKRVQELEVNVHKVTTDTLEKYVELYYDNFENEWSSFMDLRYDEVENGLLSLESKIKLELKN
ncbi:MAG TPA: hypothetical protein DCM40_10830 [Maribacter sp.]|uniref:hypothetical protein n=2 Tax=Maribacter TaxID=252356 RepID=UPI000EDBED0C|nr:hypothetical protein [Maribacter sp. UBA6511]HAI38572.1 hypothetical protein [Maribacter sp.]|tara:strand:- start:56166 stop:56726 length:561 start_codon:yes stop_codon:yes gene_type:complete